jgi:predicted membrane protein
LRSRISNILWGLFFIVLGFGFAGNAFEWWNFNLFFSGWWTLFIIVPCVITIIQRGISSGPMIGLSIGVLLLLSRQGYLDPDILSKLIVPIILIIIGLSIMFSNSLKKHKHIDYTKVDPNSLNYTAIFGEQKANFDGQPFLGAELTAVFGSVIIRADNAIITEDTVINCSAIFGGVEIYVPNDVNVKVSCTPIFGGVSNKHKSPNIPDAPTIFINATCMFGGVDIK